MNEDNSCDIIIKNAECKKGGIFLTISDLKHMNEGECADIYEIDEKTVLKLGKSSWSKEQMYREYLNGRLISESSIASPRVYDFKEIDNRFGYTMERLNDLTMLNLMWKKPWRIFAYAKKMARLHAEIHSKKAPSELPTLPDEYTGFIRPKDGISDEIKQMIEHEILEFSSENSEAICHGDFHPINILIDDEKYSVIDWVLASRGPAEADVAGTYLITSIYSSHIKGKNLFESIAASIGGKLIAQAYLKEYIAITRMDKKKILKWIPIRAATYVDVGLSDKLNRKFIRIVDKHYG